MAVLADDLALPERRFSLATAIRRNPTIAFGGILLFLLVLVAIIGPSFVGDPMKIAPVNRLRPPSERWWFGTDQFGRDVFTRTIYGSRVSLIEALASSDPMRADWRGRYSSVPGSSVRISDSPPGFLTRL